MAITERGALYVDSSSLLLFALNQSGHDGVEADIERWLSGGGRIVSSRLLALEVRRVFVRERLVGNDILSAAVLEVVAQLPVTEEVWERAAAIEQNVRAVDAIHLATCELAGATLLTAGLDRNMFDVAVARGIPVA